MDVMTSSSSGDCSLTVDKLLIQKEGTKISLDVWYNDSCSFSIIPIMKNHKAFSEIVFFIFF